jgi:hypothetical protein
VPSSSATTPPRSRWAGGKSRAALN